MMRAWRASYLDRGDTTSVRLMPSGLAWSTAFLAAGVTAGVVVGVIVAGHADRPVSLAMLAVAVGFGLSSLPSARTRRFTVSLLVVSLAVWLIWAGTSPASTVFVVAFVLAVVWIGELATSLSTGFRDSEVSARHTIERRAELLDGVRHLAGSSPREAARHVAGVLRELGLDDAEVAARTRDGEFEFLGVAAGPIDEPDAGRLAAAALSRDGSVEGFADGGECVLAAPLVVDGESYGALMAVTRRGTAPTAADTEAVEVLASHLAATVSAHRRAQRQQQLLDRLVHLERMRSGLVATVSSQIRDPLTVVSGIAQFLESQGAQVSQEERRRFLDRFAEQSSRLQVMLEQILDVAELRSRDSDPALISVDAVELLAPVLLRDGVRCVPAMRTALAGRIVHADPSMVRPGLELLTDVTAGGIGVGIVQHPSEVELRLPQKHTGQAASLASSLGSQLIVAGGGRVTTNGAVVVVWLRDAPSEAEA